MPRQQMLLMEVLASSMRFSAQVRFAPSWIRSSHGHRSSSCVHRLALFSCSQLEAPEQFLDAEANRGLGATLRERLRAGILKWSPQELHWMTFYLYTSGICSIPCHWVLTEHRYLCEGSAALDGEAAQAGHGERQLREGAAGVHAQLLQGDPALQSHHLPPESASALGSTAEASSQAQAGRQRAGRTMAAGASESQRERSRARRAWKPLTVLRVRPTHARAASLVKPVQWIPTCTAAGFLQVPNRLLASRINRRQVARPLSSLVGLSAEGILAEVHMGKETPAIGIQPRDGAHLPHRLVGQVHVFRHVKVGQARELGQDGSQGKIRDLLATCASAIAG